jgi:hypothetical protein
MTNSFEEAMHPGKASNTQAAMHPLYPYHADVCHSAAFVHNVYLVHFLYMNEKMNGAIQTPELIPSK